MINEEKRKKKTKEIPVATGKWKSKDVSFRLGRIIVKFVGKKVTESSVDAFKKKADQVAKEITGSKVLKYPVRNNLMILQIPEKEDPLKIAEELSKRPEVEFAEPDFVGKECVDPNDTDYATQWPLPIINAPQGWDMQTGGANVMLGILDSGIPTSEAGDLNHPDLDDAARYILGTDYVNDDNLPRDDNGHGTHVLGIAAAMTDNAEGIAGINWNGPVYICKVNDSTGNFAQSDVLAAVEEMVQYALDNNLLVVINLSARWTSGSATLTSVCEHVDDNGMILCAATGNDSSSSVGHPAASSTSFPGVIAVGSTDDDDTVSSFSNTGPEVTVVSPGRDIPSTMPPYEVTKNTIWGYSLNYDEMSGTSMATPHVAGLASLVWSQEPLQTNEQVRDVLINTAVKLGAGNFSNDWGYGRINAEDAIAKAGWDITLEYPSLNFMDVPEGETTVRAIRFSVKSFHATTFQIISGPSGGFGTPFATSFSLGKTSDYDTPREVYIWVSYTGTTAGDTASGSVTVRCNETEEEWTLPITANTVARPSACAMLVLDKSGSMGNPSGIGSENRIDVLRWSANVLADVIQEGNGCGIVSFDQDPHDELIPVVGPLGAITDPFDATRTSLRTAITNYSYNPLGTTSIGDGIQRGHDRLTSVTGYDTKAMIVLTDGKENTPQYIADVAALIDETVFAVGLGKAQNINPAALNEITNGTGGYTLLTDQLDNDSRFKLAKYFLQILAGISNEDIVVDPDGWIKQGEEHRIPFYLNETDISSDIIVMVPYQGVIQLTLETPEGKIIDPGTSSSNPAVQYYTGKNVAYYRISLPVPFEESGAHGGKWHAVLKVNSGYYKKYLSWLRDVDPELIGTVNAHGIQYTLLVHAYSNLKMRCSLSQSSYEPGANLTLRASLTEYGVSAQKDASVRAQLTRPDSTSTTLTLSQVESGIYEVGLTANQAGIYQFRVMADGYTFRNTRFTREQVLTGFVWRGGDQPSPESDPQEFEEGLCRLLSCLLKNMSKELLEKIKKEGLDMEGLAKCICRRGRVTLPSLQKNPQLAIAEITRHLKVLEEITTKQ